MLIVGIGGLRGFGNGAGTHDALGGDGVMASSALAALGRNGAIQRRRNPPC
ncbi:MAG TPA: hypothetical protein VEU62_10755 [Bryobacterales bacterium]|nr:hypothetical protein [Bryobacterales bacterium]